MLRPYGASFNNDNAVNVIRHDHEFINVDVSEVLRQFIPFCLGNLPSLWVLKQQFPVPTTNGYEVVASRPIIMGE